MHSKKTCKRKNKSYLPNIPFEIQTEILLRVPDVKSLIRFRSVSKQWKSFIDSPQFIKSYGARNTQPHSLLLSYRNIYNYRETKYLSFTDDDNFTQQQQDFTPNLPNLIKKRYNSVVVGYSHGLLCLFINNQYPNKEMLVLWNLSIRKSLGIIWPSYVLASNVFGFGFAVCPVTNDPTIVKISHSPWKVDMFTLSSKRWSVIKCRNVPRELVRLQWSQVVIDRCIYWIAYEIMDAMDSFRIDHMIVSFDLVAKEFRVVDVPNNVANSFSIVNIFISKLRESLVLFVPDIRAEIPACRVWKMEDDGCFTNLFTFNTPYYSIRNVFGFRKNDEPVMETQKDGEHGSALEVYEPCSERIKNFGIYGDKSTIFMASYKETLLLLDHSDSCVYPDSN